MSITLYFRNLNPKAETVSLKLNPAEFVKPTSWYGRRADTVSSYQPESHRRSEVPNPKLNVLRCLLT